MILLVFLALGCTLFWLQLTKLSSKHEELNQISVELLQLQSKILSEFDEFKKLKEELDFNFNIIDESEEEILREKRNAKNKSSVQNKRKAKKGNQGLMKRDLNLIDKSFAKLNSSSNGTFPPFLITFNLVLILLYHQDVQMPKSGTNSFLNTRFQKNMLISKGLVQCTIT